MPLDQIGVGPNAAHVLIIDGAGRPMPHWRVPVPCPVLYP